MHIAYYDESGDDGFPEYSSPFFVLSCIYLHHQNWQRIHIEVHEFRRQLKMDFGFPVKTEMHTMHFLKNKKPYNEFNLLTHQRIEIINRYCDLIANLELQIINVVVVKPRIMSRDFQVLDRAFTYSVQRIDNDLRSLEETNSKVMIITDPGRIGIMRKTTRRVQRINYIPSRYESASYRQEIGSIIEDPLQKDSRDSYFIQFSDLIATIVYFYSLQTTGIRSIPNRLRNIINEQLIMSWMDRIRPSINLRASSHDQYGVVFQPRQS